MIRLNLPEYSFGISYKNDQAFIFDPIRKKRVLLTPEEWVRQNFLQYLIDEKKVSASLIRVEMSLNLHSRRKRSDLVVFDRKTKPVMIVECKAPDISISQKTFDQIAMYNIKLQVDYLVVTNGLKHFCCKMDYEAGSYSFLQEIPSYPEMIQS